MIPKYNPTPVPVGTLFVRKKKVPGDWSADHSHLLVLAYRGKFRPTDFRDSANVYDCFDPIKQIKVKKFCHFYKQEKIWRVVEVDS